MLIRKDNKECIECDMDQLLSEDPGEASLVMNEPSHLRAGASEPPANLLELERLQVPPISRLFSSHALCAVQLASLLESLRYKVNPR